MIKSLLAALAVSCVPFAAAAVTSPTPNGSDNLSVDDYKFTLTTFTIAGDGLFTFVADDAPRTVEIEFLNYSDLDNSFDAVLEINGAAAVIGSPVQLTLAQGASAQVLIGLPAGASTVKEISTMFTVESTVVPVPAALPLIATGLAALGLVGRRRKAA